MRAKAALCHEAETLATGRADRDGISALQARWDELGTLPDGDGEAAMAQRFQQAVACASDGSTATDAAALEANQTRRESICLRLEILAGVDSPPEHADARMALQVKRLASALGEGERNDNETAESLLREWCISGPAPHAQAAALETRFERAWSASL